MEVKSNLGHNRFIVITSIFEPTEAVKAFASNENYKLVVVGDKKTPKDWQCDNAIYLSVEDQNNVGKHLRLALPYNHYCRKMLGYLYAMSQNAEYIVDTDDDNIPKQDWAFPEFEGVFDTIAPDMAAWFAIKLNFKAI